MYKKLIIIAYFLVSSLNGCELLNGVTIKEQKVSALFEIASIVFRDNQEFWKVVEDLRVQYLCLIAQFGESQAHFKGGDVILQQVESLLQAAS